MADPDWLQGYLHEVDADGYVPINCDRRLGQNQYVSRYADGRHGSANLGHGLRFRGLDQPSYHEIRIHKDDLVEFHARVQIHQDNLMNGH